MQFDWVCLILLTQPDDAPWAGDHLQRLFNDHLFEKREDQSKIRLGEGIMRVSVAGTIGAGVRSAGPAGGGGGAAVAGPGGCGGDVARAWARATGSRPAPSC